MQTLKVNVTVMRHPKRCTCMPVNKIIILFKLHVTLYFVKYNNSTPFLEEQSCQANRALIDGSNQFNPIHVEPMSMLVQKLMFSFIIS